MKVNQDSGSYSCTSTGMSPTSSDLRPRQPNTTEIDVDQSGGNVGSSKAAGYSNREIAMGLATTSHTYTTSSADLPGILTPSPSENSPVSSVGSRRVTDHKQTDQTQTSSAVFQATGSIDTRGKILSISEHRNGAITTHQGDTSSKTGVEYKDGKVSNKLPHQLPPVLDNSASQRRKPSSLPPPTPITITYRAKPPAPSKRSCWGCWSDPNVTTPVFKVDTDFDDEPVLLAISMSRRRGGIDPKVLREIIQEVILDDIFGSIG